MLSFRRIVITLTLSWLAVMVVAPHLLVLLTSFMSADTQHLAVWPMTLAGYAKVFQPIYLDVFLHSLWLSAISTAICLLIGYPFAFVLARQKRVWRNVLLVLMMLPFWTNSLIRTYAIKLILGKKGLLNTLLVGSGIVDEPLSLLYTEFAVIFGLVYILLPFMVLPLMASFEKLERELVDAARDLHASGWQTFTLLEVPSALPVFLGGLRIGATLAVIGAVVGEFVGADRGLGFLINVGRGQYDTALVFVAIFTLVFMAMALYGLVVLVESRLLAWQQRPGNSK